MAIHLSTRFSVTVVRITLLVVLAVVHGTSAFGQPTATLKGTITLGGSGQPIHNVLVTILQLKRTVGTNEQGQYELQNVPAGRYDIVAHNDDARLPNATGWLGRTSHCNRNRE